jgi:hypothetical protein
MLDSRLPLHCNRRPQGERRLSGDQSGPPADSNGSRRDGSRANFDGWKPSLHRSRQLIGAPMWTLCIDGARIKAESIKLPPPSHRSSGDRRRRTAQRLYAQVLWRATGEWGRARTMANY